MISRTASFKLKQLARKFPAIGVLGPRQSGKTTLAKITFPKKPYISFENQDNVLLVTRDPRAFLLAYKNGAIFDEVQRVPMLLSYLQGVIDENPNKTGLFILTGSYNLMLLESVSQTLAGRVALINLLPLSYAELKETPFVKQSLAQFMVRGGYPRLYDKKIAPSDFYPSYLQTYVERDVRQIKNISNLGLFQRFVKICATRVGQVVNFASISSDCGIDQKTAMAWLGILEASFIAFRLQPFYNNMGKRLLQMPKLYFYDLGVCCSLLEIDNERHLTNNPLYGALFENLVILELLKARLHNGQRSNLYYWRDRTGNEIDLLLDQAGEVVPVEIKSSSTFHNDFLKGIRYWGKIKPAKLSYMIYTGQTLKGGDTQLLNWKDLGIVRN
jgi:uncharacterized protein